MVFSKKTVTTGMYNFSHPTWDLTVPVEVYTDKKTGELSVRFNKGYEGILLRNITDTAIFKSVEVTP